MAGVVGAVGIPRDGAARNDRECGIERLGWLCWGLVCQAEDMKKQGSDQSFHDRRYQERKRAEAARKPVRKKVVSEESLPAKQNSSK